MVVLDGRAGLGGGACEVKVYEWIWKDMEGTETCRSGGCVIAEMRDGTENVEP